ncbi:cytochrome b6-f complex subunit PetL [Thermosynechococcus sp. FA-CM-4201]
MMGIVLYFVIVAGAIALATILFHTLRTVKLI